MVEISQFTELGQMTNQEVVRKFVDVSGNSVADIGCGSMTFTKILMELGANHILAVDPDPVQAKKNRLANLPSSIEFLESDASNIPVDDHSLDGVCFAYSLHHIPESKHPSVFDEVDRVVKPNGFLLVIEPTHCAIDNVMRLFHNEDDVREAAQSSLDHLAVKHFTRCEKATYYGFTNYDSFDHFVDQFANRSFNSLYSIEDIRKPEVEQAFHKFGGENHVFEGRKLITTFYR